MRLLADSDFLFGLFILTDPHYERAKSVWQDVVEKGMEIMALNLVIQEVVTVLSHKVSQQMAISFKEKFHLLEVGIVVVDEEVEVLAWKIFLQQHKKGTSFVDCANLAVIEKYKLDGIISFDMFYPKELRIG